MPLATTLELKNVTKQYQQTPVLRELNLQIRAGEFIVLLGPSGCGKSTTLRLIAGLERPSGGQVLMGGQDVATMSATERNIAMVFQDYALYPNMTVYQNLDYALRIHKVPKVARKQRLERILATLNLEDYRDRFPGQLSGGQKQRVALGRGMAKKSRLFLLDEPLSNIDVQLRERARDEIQTMHATSQQTIVYVTHDQLEAMALGDRIAVMNEGAIQMIATPDQLYRHPANLFVARFVGTPQINTLLVVAHDQQVRVGSYQVPLRPELARLLPGGSAQLILGVRPENIHLADFRPGGEGIPATVTALVDYGRYQQVDLKLTSGQGVKAVVTGQHFAPADQVLVTLAKQGVVLFDATSQVNIEQVERGKQHE